MTPLEASLKGKNRNPLSSIVTLLFSVTFCSCELERDVIADSTTDSMYLLPWSGQDSCWNEQFLITGDDTAEGEREEINELGQLACWVKLGFWQKQLIKKSFMHWLPALPA